MSLLYDANSFIGVLCRSLKKAAPNHLLLADLEEKSALFDKAAAKFSAKVST